MIPLPAWLAWAAFAGVGAVIANGTTRLSLRCQQLPSPPAAERTRVSLFVACKSAPAHLRQALESLLAQDHPEYETVFTLASQSDPAWPVVTELAAQHARCRVVVAGYSDCCGEKTHNLVQAIEAVPPADVYAFADSDIQVPRDWLSRLLAPLSDPEVGVTTAAKVPWLAADAGFCSAAFIRLVFSTQLLAFGMPMLVSAWGGSMAMTRRTFERLGVARRWSRAVDDDISVSRYVRAAGLRIHFVPLFVPTRVPTAMRQAFGWSVRQMQYLYLYYRPAWFTVAFLTVLPTLALAGLAWTGQDERFWACVGLHVAITGSILSTANRVAAGRPEARGWGRFPVWSAVLSPVTVAMAAGAATVAALRRTMVWGGVTYRLDGPEQVRVLSRATDMAAVGPFEPAPDADTLPAWDAPVARRSA